LFSSSKLIFLASKIHYKKIHKYEERNKTVKKTKTKNNKNNQIKQKKPKQKTKTKQNM